MVVAGGAMRISDVRWPLQIATASIPAVIVPSGKCAEQKRKRMFLAKSTVRWCTALSIRCEIGERRRQGVTGACRR